MEYLQLIFWALIGSVFSMIGGVVLLVTHKKYNFTDYVVPFGAGALLAAASVTLLPESIEQIGAQYALYWMLGGFIGFFLLERVMGVLHHHEEHHTKHDKEAARNKSHVTMIMIGDTLHNAIDGVAIGAAFAVNPALGIATAIAVAAHEVPQEIGNYGIMLAKGVKPIRVLMLNFASALATVVAAAATYVFAPDLFVAPLLAIAAGIFIYFSASDIIPEIHENKKKLANMQAAMLAVGVLAIVGVAQALPHSHEYDGHDHTEAGGTHHEEHAEDGEHHDHEETEHVGEDRR